MLKILRRTLPLCLLLLSVTACGSNFVTIAPRPPAKYEKLGPAEGSAGGFLAIGPTAYNFIPIRLNSRAIRAYNAAVKSVPNATGLINVTYKESWFWWVIGTSRFVTVTGEAIKEIK